jgi:hypothetical protein
MPANCVSPFLLPIGRPHKQPPFKWSSLPPEGGLPHNSASRLIEADAGVLRQMPLNSPPSIRSDAPVIHFAAGDTK